MLGMEKTLRERCHVNTNDDGDSFVGMKADTTDMMIYFPIGCVAIYIISLEC